MISDAMFLTLVAGFHRLKLGFELEESLEQVSVALEPYKVCLLFMRRHFSTLVWLWCACVCVYERESSGYVFILTTLSVNLRVQTEVNVWEKAVLRDSGK